jgi:hypothetical protein
MGRSSERGSSLTQETADLVGEQRSPLALPLLVQGGRGGSAAPLARFVTNGGVCLAYAGLAASLTSSVTPTAAPCPPALARRGSLTARNTSQDSAATCARTSTRRGFSIERMSGKGHSRTYCLRPELAVEAIVLQRTGPPGRVAAACMEGQQRNASVCLLLRMTDRTGSGCLRRHEGRCWRERCGRGDEPRCPRVDPARGRRRAAG